MVIKTSINYCLSHSWRSVENSGRICVVIRFRGRSHITYSPEGEGGFQIIERGIQNCPKLIA